MGLDDVGKINGSFNKEADRPNPNERFAVAWNNFNESPIPGVGDSRSYLQFAETHRELEEAYKGISNPTEEQKAFRIAAQGKMNGVVNAFSKESERLDVLQKQQAAAESVAGRATPAAGVIVGRRADEDKIYKVIGGSQP